MNRTRTTQLIALIVLNSLFACCAMAQIEHDWMSKVRIPDPTTQVEPEEAPTPPEEAPTPPEDAPTLAPPASDVLDKLFAAANSAHEAAARATEVAGALEGYRSEVRELKDAQSNFVTRSEFESLKDVVNSKPSFTEGEIRAFAAEEAKKLFEQYKSQFRATVEMPNGKVTQVPADTMQQTVNGFSGTFTVPKGGYVSSVDGQRVNSGSLVNNQWTSSTQDLSLAANNGTVTFQTRPAPAQPRQFMPRSKARAQSANATCRTVWNPATRRFETRCE